MKIRMKSVLAALLAMAMCVGMAGCGDKPPKDINDWTDKDFENAANQLEEQYDKDKKDKDDKPAKSEEKKDDKPANSEEQYSENNNDNNKDDEPVKNETVEYAPTDEILSADICSGLIQFNNDVFQQGGYITVADFIEKYKDSYVIHYVSPSTGVREETPYEECTDYLLKYVDANTICKSSYYAGQLILTPKYGNATYTVVAYIANVTSPDEKITLDKGVVLSLNAPIDKYYTARTPAWFPKGILCSSQNCEISPHKQELPENIKSENENYTSKAFIDMLEEKGFTEAVWGTPNDNPKKYSRISNNSDNVSIYFEGEPNLFGKKPKYSCIVSFNPNTDKLDRISYRIDEFVD